MDFSKIIEFASNIFKRKAEEYLNSIDSANNIDIPLK